MNLKSILPTACILAATLFLVPSTWAEPVVRSQAADTDSAEGSGNKVDTANRKDRKKGSKSKQQRSMRTPEMLIERFDSDGDGKLAVTELSGRMQKRLSKIDTDEDGFVSASELRTALEKRGGRGGKGKGEAGKGEGGKGKQGQKKMDPAKFFQRLDKDGDEKIALTEVPKRMQAGFAKADTDGDGFLDLAELSVVMERFQAMRGDKKKGDKKVKDKRDKKDGQKPITPKRPPA